ncbi:hypothetical protein [Dyadobacter sp. CY347]|uniref:hypothetical protein n=1 Tax=Dyadobacter sp. CY347 TaxID=2909336 RepID=UPI001F200D5E|nr:hypothetical protein [Dyadobacter sp. CY347]MCF2487357.1 hypothetical protein [Dyadobacter sp. CY347]
MKRFILNITVFMLITFLAIFTSLFWIHKEGIEDNMLAAIVDKHKLLSETKSPKIILVGGSNLSFGLESAKIEDAFHLPVINSAIHAGIGLKFYFSDIKQYIRQGDIVVIVPEYSQYYSDSFYGSLELVSILFDVYPEGRKLIDKKQWYHLAKLIPTYAATKLSYQSTTKFNTRKVGVYDRKSFNSRGDAYIHWSLPRQQVAVAKKNSPDDKARDESILFLKECLKFIAARNATMIVLPPVYQGSSYENQEKLINQIFAKVQASDLPLAAEPIRYKFPDSLFYNTNYHLTKAGVDLRTSLLIEDIAPYINGKVGTTIAIPYSMK